MVLLTLSTQPITMEDSGGWGGLHTVCSLSLGWRRGPSLLDLLCILPSRAGLTSRGPQHHCHSANHTTWLVRPSYGSCHPGVGFGRKCPQEKEGTVVSLFPLLSREAPWWPRREVPSGCEDDPGHRTSHGPPEPQKGRTQPATFVTALFTCYTSHPESTKQGGRRVTTRQELLKNESRLRVSGFQSGMASARCCS